MRRKLYPRPLSGKKYARALASIADDVPRTAAIARKGAPLEPRKDPKAGEVKLPPLYVAISGRSYYGQKYAKARLRIRRGCYAYLVWRDGQATREFYLGKRENLTLQKIQAPGELATSTRSRSGSAARGTK